MIDINNQQDYFTYYLFQMRKTKAKVKWGIDWIEVVKLLLPLSIFGMAMFYLGTLIK
jgi:hypothetical protein